ncbi:hypothetical protein [Lentibacillus sp. Marseille-P4043]|uniref:hypothetical protein n=1 Tax=Lentibacillus sp. Marseille-P4043 TaxID=2040293 RepID=UPI000D0B8B83|nr:hypothetical protein [Lentibacillus sp. Marseille-P4043]
MGNKKSTLIWGAIIAVLIVLAYLLPYTVMSDVKAWYGSFLIWGIIGILIIIATIIVTKDWGKED